MGTVDLHKDVVAVQNVVESVFRREYFVKAVVVDISDHHLQEGRKN